MANLTGKQKRYLRSIGQRMGEMATIGQAGVTESVAEHLRRLLAEHELVKLRLTLEQGAERKESAAAIAQATGSEVAGVVGRTVLLYKANPSLPADKRIAIRE